MVSDRYSFSSGTRSYNSVVHPTITSECSEAYDNQDYIHNGTVAHHCNLGCSYRIGSLEDSIVKERSKCQMQR